MPRTSLLFLNKEVKNASIHLQVFEDINLTKLLPEQTIKILQTPCDRDEITARQQLFRELDHDLFRDAFNRMAQALTGLSQSLDAYRNSLCRCEKLILFRRFAEKYSLVLSAARGLHSESPFIKAFTEYLFRLPDKELDASLAATAEEFAQISSFGLRFLPDRAAADTADVGGESLTAQILRAASELGFDELTQPRQKEVRISNVLNDVLLQLYPKQFGTLGTFEQKFRPLLDETITGYRAEIEFYLSVYELTQRAIKKGIAVCYPQLSDDRMFRAAGAADISLLVKDSDVIVPNDINFAADDSVYFLTGANGGGKTTYLRSVAGNLLFALGGCPVFCESAEVYPFTSVFSHFPADERFIDSGRLVEEEKRMGEIMAKADAGSFVLLNETYSGTDEKKGAALTLDTAMKLKKRGSFALYVTHFHEVNGQGIPMLNTVIDDTDENRRTFKIVKSTDLSSSYAYDILKKYRLTKEALAKRLGEI
ncbi:MAG: MutS-related protein [Eubacteriales bacterium]